MLNHVIVSYVRLIQIECIVQLWILWKLFQQLDFTGQLRTCRNIRNTPQYTITPPVALVLCDNPSNWTDAFAALQRSCTRLHNRTAWQTQRFHMKITCIPYTVYHTIWYPTANHNWGATCLGEDTHSAMMRHPDANHNASRSHQHVFFNVFVGPSFQPQHSKLKTHAHTQEDMDREREREKK